MGKKLYSTVGLIILIIVMVNLVAMEYHVRLDFTEDHEYTLSKATIDILHGLQEPVTVKAYFSENLPANVEKVRRDFQEMLTEYANRANGNLLYEFDDPSKDQSTEQEIQQKGIRPILINVREKDQVKQQKAYLGAVVSLGDQDEPIPFIEPGSAMEYALSTAIKKLSVKDKPKVGFLQGHGEPPLSEMSQLESELDVLYDCQQVNIDSTTLDPSIKTLAIIRPTDTIPPATLNKLSQFLNDGGHIVVAINRVDADLRSSTGYATNTGLETWLTNYGVSVADNFVVDAKCGQINVVQQTGMFSIQQRVAFPYLPLVSAFDSDHPITKGLESVLFKFVSTVRFIGDSTLRFTPLVFSSDMSTALKAPQYFDVQKQWAQNDFPDKHLALGGVVEQKKSNGWKMVVFGDGDFVVNGPAQQGQQQQLQGDNVNLMSNAIDWLSDDTGLIALRTKGATSRPIEELDDSTRALLKYLNFLVPIILVIAYGIVRAQRNKMLRLRRMSERYEED